MTLRRIVQALAALTLLCGCAVSQTTTGTLLGTITDPGDAAVPNVPIEIKNLTTGATRNTVSGPEGIFRFNSLEPARYNLAIKAAAGFKTYSQTGIDVTANEVRDLGRIQLALGALTEEISVTATATPVQTASSENSQLVDSSQMVDLTLKGRDMFAVLMTVPGVYLGSTYLSGGDATSEGAGIGTFSINGGGQSRANFTVDGITDMDTGSNGTLHYEPTMDTIGEIRVLTSNYQAEYGRNSGGTVAVVTKGGGQEFHGSGYANKRHEMFNAKNFFNNYNNTPKSVYRFFVWGYSIGGPVYIPHLFNTQKKKLFFFFSQEYTKQKPATQTGVANVPTAAQESGNFFDRCASGTGVNGVACTPAYTDGNGTNRNANLVDPSNGKAPLAGGNLNSLIGTSYYDAASAALGQAMLKFFPVPNLCTAAAGIYNNQAISNGNCPTGYSQSTNATWNYNYNYFWQFNEVHPRRNDTLRMDYNVTQKLSTWVRWTNDYDLDDTSGNIALKNSQGQWVPYSEDHPNPGHGYGVGITYTISPTMVDEFTFGKSYNNWSYYAHDPTQLARSNMGSPPSFDNFVTDPAFVKDTTSGQRADLGPGRQNFDVEIPTVAFGGGQAPNEVTMGGNQRPYTNWQNLYSFNDALSKVIGKHNLKAGLYIEHTEKVWPQALGAYLGSYAFASGGAVMAADTQEGYANAWLGNMNNYSEGQKSIGNTWFWQVEAFVQDNWRISRRVTLDLGVRFYHMPPFYNVNVGPPNGQAEFVPSAYSAATAERIYYPGCTSSTASGSCPGANQYAIDPVTGYKTFYSLNGTLVPPSVGGYSTAPTPYPGMVIAGTSGLPTGLFTAPALSPAFRFGLAWDVFGNGKTALRAGFGQFLNRGDQNQILAATGQQPITQNRTIYYTNVQSVLNPTYQANAAISPIAPGIDYLGKQPYEASYNGSFMIQQNVGFSTVLEASWVFNMRRHINASVLRNYSPLYSQYSPSWVSPMTQYLLNPSLNGGLTQGNAGGLDLSANYFYGPSLCPGCVFGLGGLSANNFDTSSHYDALQITLRRNMTKHLSYGASYNFSKNMGTIIGNGGSGNAASHSPMFSDKFRNWGPSYLPTPQTLTVNYAYEIPNPGQKLNFKPLGWITDHWTWSGITQWRSNQMTGIPGISFTGTNATSYPQENWTGSQEGARMVVTGNYKLSSLGQSWSFNGGAAVASSQGTPATNGYGMLGTPGNQLINTQVFTIPNPCSLTASSNPRLGIGENMACFGNAGAGSLINVPGTRVANFDMTFAKSFPLKSEKRVIMFRAEMYNIFNHTNFSGYSIGPSYDWRNWLNGNLVQTNSGLGRMSSTLNPRQMSMSLRFQF